MTKQIINLETIATLRQFGGEEIIKESFLAFEEETKRLMEKATQAISQDDKQTLQDVSHTIKGSARTLGIEKLGDSAAVLEQSSQLQHTDLQQAHFEEMQRDFQEFLTNYKQILEL